MSEESREKDFGAAWRGQPEETVPVNRAQLVNRRARELHSSTRSEILMSVGAALFFVAVLAWRFEPRLDTLQQLGFAAVVVWVAITLYWFRDRIWRESPPPKDALAATGLEFYRKELERRRDHLRSAWLWHGPLFLACLTLAAIIVRKAFPGPQRLLSVLPLAVVLVIWTGFSLVRRRRQANELQREIDEIGRL